MVPEAAVAVDIVELVVSVVPAQMHCLLERTASHNSDSAWDLHMLPDYTYDVPCSGMCS